MSTTSTTSTISTTGTTHLATCSCGHLKVSCVGAPIRASMCHCLECQKRTGSVFGVQARFTKENVTITGSHTEWSRKGDSGGTARFHFCPTCGSTVFWTIDEYPEAIAIAVGAFADPSFMAPKFSVYEARRHSWTKMPELTDIEIMD